MCVPFQHERSSINFSVNIASALQGDFALAQSPLFIPFHCSPFLTVIHDKIREEKFHGYPFATNHGWFWFEQVLCAQVHPYRA